MKNQMIIVLFALVSLVSACKQVSENKESSIWVRGNCDMCKERIEGKVRKIAGVSRVVYNVETGMMVVNYDSTMVKEMDLHQAVASTGHATKLVPMNQTAHDSLPECCQVDGEHAEQPASVKDSVTSCCSSAGSCALHKDKSCCSDKGVCSKDGKSCKDAKGTCMSADKNCCTATGKSTCCSVEGHCTLDKTGKTCCSKEGTCSKDGNSCTSDKGKCQTSAGGCCS